MRATQILLKLNWLVRNLSCWENAKPKLKYMLERTAIVQHALTFSENQIDVKELHFTEFRCFWNIFLSVDLMIQELVQIKIHQFGKSSKNHNKIFIPMNPKKNEPLVFFNLAFLFISFWYSCDILEFSVLGRLWMVINISSKSD